MDNYLKRLPKGIQGLIYLASEVAAENNMPAYLVGGCVRDLFLGVNNLDLDIVIEGSGIKFSEDLEGLLQGRLIRHKRFGTATLSVGNNLKIDIATARREFYPHPGSLPQVTAGLLKDDLARRDFTINAVAISITAKDWGRLIDIFDGLSDLKLKKIRILHDLSFIDDPTRILRAIRFEKRYNFRIEPKSLRLLKEAARLKMLDKVQPQRLRDELILILKEKRPIKQIKRMQELVGFSFLNSCLLVNKKTYSLFNSIEKQVEWFREEYPERRNLDTWLIYLMALLDSLKIKDICSISQKFVFRKGEAKRIKSYIKERNKIARKLCKNRVRSSRIFNLLNPLSYEVILLIKAKAKNRNIDRHIADFLEIYNGIRLYIKGEDLYNLGLRPGPQYKKIFSKALNAKIEGRVRTKEEELALIRKLLDKV